MSNFDAPAGRDVRGPARDPAPLVHPAGGRERDGGVLEGGAGIQEDALSVGVDQAGATTANAKRRAQPSGRKGSLCAARRGSAAHDVDRDGV